MSTVLSTERRAARRVAEGAAFSIILALGFSHFLNDMMQSLLPALYPMLKGAYGLSFAQIGLITLTSQLISSVLQPAVGLFADHRPQPYSLAIGMGVTFIGLLLLASAGSYPMLVFAAALVGVGSAVFHPEASRVARMASGGRHGLAQSLFQVGGNVGSSLGPVLAAFIVIPRGQSCIAWFSAAALLAMAVLFAVGNWYRRERTAPPRPAGRYMAQRPGLSRRRIGWSIVILLAVIFSKSFYTTSLNSYYTFYLISRFDVSIETAQIEKINVVSARGDVVHPRHSAELEVEGRAGGIGCAMHVEYRALGTERGHDGRALVAYVDLDPRIGGFHHHLFGDEACLCDCGSCGEHGGGSDKAERNRVHFHVPPHQLFSRSRPRRAHCRISN